MINAEQRAQMRWSTAKFTRKREYIVDCPSAKLPQSKTLCSMCQALIHSVLSIFWAAKNVETQRASFLLTRHFTVLLQEFQKFSRRPSLGTARNTIAYMASTPFRVAGQERNRGVVTIFEPGIPS
jgi:hypothetical protein